MIKETLYIKWDTGEMEIVLSKFFPTTVERFKKLRKIIWLDWQNQDESIEFLKAYFQNKKAEHENLSEQYHREYYDNQNKLGEYKFNNRGNISSFTLRKMKSAVTASLRKHEEHKHKAKQFQRHLRDISLGGGV